MNGNEIGLEQTWRWFGPNDPIPLSHIKMAGATGIVTALHHIPNGNIWPIGEILERKRCIEAAGLHWSVVESVPIHEDIKTGTGAFKTYLDNYKKTIENLGKAGIHTLCYNFMPVLDWTRTDLNFEMPDGSKALRFDIIQFAVFDLFLLERTGAQTSYSEAQCKEAQRVFHTMTEEEKDILSKNILAGLPGAEEGYSLTTFTTCLERYNQIRPDDLRQNLSHFLQEIVPVAEQSGVYLAIHPDDPPFPILGLPRIVSTESDIEQILALHESDHHGICFCTGSLGVRLDNMLSQMIKHFAHRIHFVHLRSTQSDQEGNFYEADHLNGNVDMYEILKALLLEQKKRIGTALSRQQIPMRPDHGHQMLDDLKKTVNPGYSAIGRLRGLAELRGLELGIKKSLKL